MSFARLLYQLPTDRLQEIIRRRAATLKGIPRISTKRELATFLADALSHPHSISEALAETDLLQLRVLTLAIVRGGQLGFDKLIAADATPDVQQRIMLAATELESSGLAIVSRNGHRDGSTGSDTVLVVPNAVCQNTPLPTPLRHNLPGALQNYDAGSIGLICATLGLTADQTGVAGGAARAITSVLTDRVTLSQIVGALPKEVIRVLGYMLSHGGVATLPQLAECLDARHRNQLYSYDWSRRWAYGKPRNPVEELVSRGILTLPGAVGWGFGHLVIPGNVMEVLSGKSWFPSDAPGIPDWQILEPQDDRIQRHETLCRDIAYMLGYIGRTIAVRTSKGNIHRNTLKTVAKSLTFSTLGYAEFVYAMSRELGLIAPQGRNGAYSITPQGIAWLDQPLETQSRELFETWLRQWSWAETAAEPLTDAGAFYYYDDLKSYRKCAISLLSDLAKEYPGKPATIESLTQRARYRWWSRFPGTSSGSSDAEPDDGIDREGPEMDDRRDLALLEFICAGSMYWLGLTEIARSSRGRPTHVCLSPRGRAQLLGETTVDHDQTERPDKFVVQPNMDVYAPLDLAPGLLFRLFRVAETRGSGMLAITRETLRCAFDRGETPESLLGFLRKHSKTPLPQNVEYLINEVGGRHGHIRIGHAGIYMKVTDPILLQEIKADKKLKIHVRAELADTVALITGESVDAILRQLRQAGYLPVADDSSNTAAHDDMGEEVTWIRRPPSPRKVASPKVESQIDWLAVRASEGVPWDVASSPSKVSKQGGLW